MVTTTTGLPKDWAYSPSIDLELKQYILLGYVQRVQARFLENKLYPHLADLQLHATDLLQLQRSKDSLTRSLHTTLIGFDPATGNPMRSAPEEPEPLRVIDAVIDFAVPNLKRMLEQGLELRDKFAQRIQLHTIGLQPLHATEGWLLLRRGHEARAYAYTIPMVQEQDPDHSHRNVLTRFVATYSATLANTFERMKSDLIHKHPELPNPATFAVESDVELPCIETLIPLAKRLVHAHVMATV